MNTPKESTIGKNTSLEKTFQILDCFIHNTSAKYTLSELCHETGLNLSTCYRLAEALFSHGFLFKDEREKSYSLGWKFMLLSSAERVWDRVLWDIAPSYMTVLRDKYQENVSIYTQIERKRKCLIRIEGTQEVRNVVKQGSISDIYLGSPGKVLLAYLPPEERGFYADITPEFEQELDQVLANGYSSTTAERTPGVTSISAPIFNAKGEIIAALSMSAPTFRFVSPNFDEKIQDVIRYARQITEAICQEMLSWQS